MHRPCSTLRHISFAIWLLLGFFWLNSVVADTPTENPAPEPKDDKTLPLKADKTLNFSVNEATWMSLDISPQGDRLVIEVLGDLYLLPIEGGRARSEALSLAARYI